jgi:flavin reductase (DIM6/NTAB) family NADH-FMN oxidoreductase RutF
MRWDMDKVDEPTAYKLLAATVVPRPIAWVVSLNADGGRNAAPFSFFNVMCSDPPTLVLGINVATGRGMKDSARNILEQGDFSVNLVSEAQVHQMNITALDAPAGVDELALAGVATVPASHIAPPLIAEAPVSMECRLHSHIELGPGQIIVVGSVLAVHVADRFVQDAARAHFDTPSMGLVGRSFGAEYIRTEDRFDLPRPTWADWQKTHPAVTE